MHMACAFTCTIHTHAHRIISGHNPAVLPPILPAAWQGAPEPTHMVNCFFRYALVAGKRMLMYGVHLVSQQLAAEVGACTQPARRMMCNVLVCVVAMHG